MLRSLLFCSFLFTSIPAHAGKKRPLLLWEVKKDGAVSHLMGTCHVPLPLSRVLPKPHHKKLERARVLVTEIDKDTIEPIASLRSLMDDRPTLPEHLGPEPFMALSQRYQMVPAGFLARMHPWAAYSTLAAIQMQSSEEGTAILDIAVATKAEQEGVAGMALETYEQQVTFLSGIDEVYIELLKSGTEAAERVTDQQNAVLDGCRTGDTSAVEAMLADPEAREVLGPLLFDRNREWMEPLTKELAQGDAFVAVGAAHMLGDEGLVALLEADGYEVTQLRGKAEVADPFPSQEPIMAGTAHPFDPEWLDFWARSGLYTQLCAVGQPVRTCFVPDESACVATVRAEASLCAAQLAPHLPEPGEPVDSSVAQQLIGCAIGGLALDALAKDQVPDTPVCTPIAEEMKKAMADAVP